MAVVENVNNMTLFAPRSCPPTEESFLQVLHNNMGTFLQNSGTSLLTQQMGTSPQQTTETSPKQASRSPTNVKDTDVTPVSTTSPVQGQNSYSQGVYNGNIPENQNGNNNASGLAYANVQSLLQPYGQLASGMPVIPASYPSVQPGFINGSFTLVNSTAATNSTSPYQMASQQPIPNLLPYSSYLMPTAYTYPPPPFGAQPSQPVVQPQAATQTTGIEDWKNQKLAHLQKNPLLADFQPGLEKECDSDAFGFAYNYNANNQGGAGQCSSTTELTHPPPPPQMSVTVRASLLRVRLAKLTESLPMQGAALQQVYKQRAASIEKARYTEVLATQTTPWLIPTVNSKYDTQHHDVITSIEQNLQFLERNTGDNKSTAEHSENVTDKQEYSHMTTDAATYVKYTHQPGYKFNSQGVLPDQMISTASKKLLEAWYEKNKHLPYPKSLLGLAREVRTSVHNVRQWLKQRGAGRDREGGEREGGRKKQRTE